MKTREHTRLHKRTEQASINMYTGTWCYTAIYILCQSGSFQLHLNELHITSLPMVQIWSVGFVSIGFKWTIYITYIITGGSNSVFIYFYIPCYLNVSFKRGSVPNKGPPKKCILYEYCVIFMWLDPCSRTCTTPLHPQHTGMSIPSVRKYQNRYWSVPINRNNSHDANRSNYCSSHVMYLVLIGVELTSLKLNASELKITCGTSYSVGILQYIKIHKYV